MAKKGIQAGQAYISISADLSGLKRGADSAKKVMAELKASFQALGRGNIGTALTLGIHSIGTAVSAMGSKLKSFGLSLSAFGRGVMSYGSKMMAFAGMGMAGVAYVTKRFINMGDALNKMSARTGATVEWLSAMSFGAERSGATIEMLEQAIRKLNKAIAEAQKGNKTLYEAFRRLRIDPTSMQFRNMDAGAQFELVARRLNEVQSQAEKTRLAMALFEEGGVMLLPMLGDIDRLKQKAKELGIIMTKDQADTAAALLDSWTNVKYQLNAIFMSLGEAIAPALKQVATWMSKMVKPIKNFVDQNRELFMLMAKGLALFLVIGGIIATFGAILGGIGLALKSIGSMFVLTGGMVKGFAVAIGSVFGSVFGLAGKAASGISGLSKTIAGLLKDKFGLEFALSHPWFAFINVILLATMVLNKFARKFSGFGKVMNNLSVSAGGQLKGLMKGLMNGLLNVFKVINPFTWARNLILVSSLIVSEFEKIGRLILAFPLSTWAWLAGIVAVVGAIGYIIYKTNALGKLWQWLKGVWQDVCNFFSEKWSETTSAIGDSFGVIWDAVMLGNFKGAWDLLCKDMLVTWDIWTLEISDTWDAMCANLKNLWASLWYGGIIQAYEWCTNRILTSWEYVKGKFAYGWEWIASSCKAAFAVIVVWIQNTFDDIMTAMKKTMNRLKSWMPGTGYHSHNADIDNRMLDRENERRKAQRESEIGNSIAGSDEKLRKIEQETSERIKKLNDELEYRMQMYRDLVKSMHDQNDSELTAEMERRRADIAKLKAEIAKETADLRAKNEAMKKENAIQHDDYYKVWEDIADNTEETAENTRNKEATADVNAQAITVRWANINPFVNVMQDAIRMIVARQQQQRVNLVAKPNIIQQPAPTRNEQVQIKDSVSVSSDDKTKIEEIGFGVMAIRDTLSAQSNYESTYSKSMGEKMQRMLEKLTELTRNSRKYSENIEAMLTAR